MISLSPVTTTPAALVMFFTGIVSLLDPVQSFSCILIYTGLRVILLLVCLLWWIKS
ncbi:hypothetical protein NFI96_029971 [Prochilodus magdalenae]|nr:hypothetical protein NFI96_029971 [Prochilodus magdalenae]